MSIFPHTGNDKQDMRNKISIFSQDISPYNLIKCKDNDSNFTVKLLATINLIMYLLI